MAAAYSMDLRDRVIKDADAGVSSKELAARYHVSRAWVDEGPTLKRFRPRAQGRGYKILKRTSHITVIVSDESGAAKNGASTSRGGTR